MLTWQFPLKRDATDPLYQQIAAHIKEAIMLGTLHDQERLPPIRALASMLDVSQITVTQSYELLAKDGFVVSHVGRGTFVSHRRGDSGSGQATSESPARREHQTAMHSGTSEGQASLPGLSREQWLLAFHQAALIAQQGTFPIHFSEAFPDPTLFPMQRWQQSMRSASRALTDEADAQHDLSALQYGPALGDASLRRHLAITMTQMGMPVEPDEILLTSGTQQSLDLLTRTLLSPGDPLFIEELSYIAALDIFERQRVTWRTLPLDEQGMQVNVLAQHLTTTQPRPNPPLLYTIPTGHNPTGICMSAERRNQLADLAQRHQFLLIEDHAFDDLYFGKIPFPVTLHSLATQKNVISLFSFSKTIFPMVRMGCIIAARSLIEQIAQTKQIYDRSSSIPLARAVLRHISAPAYSDEMRRFRTHYLERRDHLLEELDRHLRPLACHWTIPEAGFSLILTLPPQLRAFHVIAAAAEQGLLLMPGACFAPLSTTRWENSIRLAYGNLSTKLLTEATRRLLKALQMVSRSGTKAIPQFPYLPPQV